MGHDTVRVAIVGGGRTGTPLLESLLEKPFVEIVGVADVDSESPGAVLARENNLFLKGSHGHCSQGRGKRCSRQRIRDIWPG